MRGERMRILVHPGGANNQKLLGTLIPEALRGTSRYVVIAITVTAAPAT
jgi:hypothetical protein